MLVMYEVGRAGDAVTRGELLRVALERAGSAGTVRTVGTVTSSWERAFHLLELKEPISKIHRKVQIHVFHGHALWPRPTKTRAAPVCVCEAPRNNLRASCRHVLFLGPRTILNVHTRLLRLRHLQCWGRTIRAAEYTPGRARVQVGVHELHSPGIRGKGTGAAQFPTESVSEQLAREQ